MRIAKPPRRLYYSLERVAQLTGVSAQQIQQWLEEFSQLKAVRSKGGSHYFREADLSLIFRLKTLLIEEGRSVKEARSELKRPSPAAGDGRSPQFRRLLAEAKLELREILDLLGDA